MSNGFGIYRMSADLISSSSFFVDADGSSNIRNSFEKKRYDRVLTGEFCTVRPPQVVDIDFNSTTLPYPLLDSKYCINFVNPPTIKIKFDKSVDPDLVSDSTAFVLVNGGSPVTLSDRHLEDLNRNLFITLSDPLNDGDDIIVFVLEPLVGTSISWDVTATNVCCVDTAVTKITFEPGGDPGISPAYPADGAMYCNDLIFGHSHNPTINIFFDQLIDPASLVAGSVTLTDAAGDFPISSMVVTGGGDQVQVAMSGSGFDDLTPDGFGRHIITINATSLIKTLVGGCSAVPASWSVEIDHCSTAEVTDIQFWVGANHDSPQPPYPDQDGGAGDGGVFPSASSYCTDAMFGHSSTPEVHIFFDQAVDVTTLNTGSVHINDSIGPVAISALTLPGPQEVKIVLVNPFPAWGGIFVTADLKTTEGLPFTPVQWNAEVSQCTDG